MDQSETIQDIREKLVRIEMLLDNMVNSTSLKFENMEEKLKVANNRISDLEKNNTWLWRTVVGSLIAGVIALLLK